MDFPITPDQNPNKIPPSSSVSPDEVSSGDCKFSDALLQYINQMLMEEDMEEEKSSLFQDSSALQAAEKPFYEILADKHPSSSSSFSNNTTSTSSSSSSNNTVDTNSIDDNLSEYKSSLIDTSPTDYTFQATPQSSFSSPQSLNFGEEGLDPDLYCDNEPVWQFNRGLEEASKFLPNDNDLFINLERSETLHREAEVGKKDDTENSPNGSRGKKNLKRDDRDLEEGRSNKQSAIFSEESVRSAMFDMVLLCKGQKEHLNANIILRESVKAETEKNLPQNGNSKVSNGAGGKSRGKKQKGKEDVVDLRTLLVHCSQSVAADDRRSANELLKQLRQHSSPFGDGFQRLAHCFADGLEARLAGNGSQICATIMNKKTSASEFLKAYQLYLAACPYMKVTNFFTNHTIMRLAKNATTLHIIDFGIYFGFQWPCLIEHLSKAPGGPPKLRITGIDFPQSGFRPAERVEETGRRLANYADSFNVPFEYNAIAQKWETIQVEDLKINKGEVLVVNSVNRLSNLLDETVMLDCPRNAVLNLIRNTNPDVFIHGIVNGAYSAPFFVTRFREALFHYSALFDMLETNVPREHPERIFLEKDIFGREALNVIACEGSERVERPETYKQWQVRNMRAGFTKLPLNMDVVRKAKEKVKANYHKDFVIDEDSQWLLQGWKGRIVYALSSWKPAQNS